MFITVRKPSASHQKLPLLQGLPLSLAVPCSQLLLHLFMLSPDPEINQSHFFLLKKCQWSQESNKPFFHHTGALKMVTLFPSPQYENGLGGLAFCHEAEKTWI